MYMDIILENDLQLINIYYMDIEYGQPKVYKTQIEFDFCC